MRNGVVHEVQNMRVGERVNDRLSHPPSLQQARRQQDLEARRHCGDLFLLQLGEPTNIQLALSKTDQDAQPLWISERAKHLCRQFELVLVRVRDHVALIIPIIHS
jgi:hypothetical protein